jgi:hypothetical protein
MKEKNIIGTLDTVPIKKFKKNYFETLKNVSLENEKIVSQRFVAKLTKSLFSYLWN